MNFRSILILLLFFSSNLFSAYPTAEDLFKNTGNQEVAGNQIVLKFQVEESDEKRIKSELEGDLSNKDVIKTEIPEALTLEKHDKFETKYLTWTFSLKKESKIELFQEVYSDSLMKSPHLELINYLGDYHSKIRDDNNLERSLFYAIISSLVLNDSRGMVEFLMRHEPTFLSNTMLLNREKIKHLEKYKLFLAEKKDKNLPVPTPSLDEDASTKKKQMDEMMHMSMYQKNNQVSLQRLDGNFFWMVNLPTFKAYYKNENRDLYKVDFNKDTANITTIMGNYMLFDGIHQLPKRILFKTTNGRNFIIRILELKHVSQAADLNKLNDQFKKIIDNKERSSSRLNQRDQNGPYFFVK
ncbi:MAG: hypothetical protein A2381_12135 [Bdellovibrionales bacterium RIFOXYB1_FULL_37_110]|nr:MAG: hypothetical protein A2181_01855 [Bdellovibrionales bacterium RIFOXYA1_FULL_38_20]OFZ52244.1 MAG: hypothetical protein A2417_05975 [Bdellovibrionales bacterium RIFOXYC1_FULL_37_79]OFZ57231.1 MAG: hypothetical protein A2381_12135 [Bdellovibrionales bacterium RIFOXYB1_FULL_37_110]OFZ65233.1 MAG: hypothetical protein A2577_04570 [Bdellovibrionales bacterium RIFOXYD1_FULL_36_51]